jgi:hypothetical protein
MDMEGMCIGVDHKKFGKKFQILGVHLVIVVLGQFILTWVGMYLSM